MRTEEFDFDTEKRVMPADPVELRGKKRENGRMVVLDRSADTVEHTVFSDIVDHLRPGDLLVLNDSYMLSNTLTFRHGDRTLDLNVYGHEPGGTNIVKISSGEQLRPREALTSVDDERLTCTLLESQPDDLWKVAFEPAELLIETLDRHGRRVDENIHLDPTSWREQPDAYRSVYAKTPGSLEIPSAGLHFSKELLDRVVDKGVELAYITLHVGATEILAVRHISAEKVEDHEVRPNTSRSVRRPLRDSPVPYPREDASSRSARRSCALSNRSRSTRSPGERSNHERTGRTSISTRGTDSRSLTSY